MKTFRNRVFILILIPTIVLFLVITITVSIYFNVVLKDQAISKKQSELGLTTRAVDDWLISRLSELVLLSRNRFFLEKNRPEIKKLLLAEHQRLSFLYDKFWVISPEGWFWNTENEDGTIEGHGILRSFFSDKKYLHFFIPAASDPVFGKSIVLCSLMYKEDSLNQALCASVPFQWFDRVVRYFTANFFDEVYVGDPTGIIISHNNNALIGKREIAVYGRVFSVNAELEDSHVFVFPLKNKWKTVGIIKKDRLFQQINKTNQYASVLIISSLVVIVLISFGITRIVVNPIRVLTEGVKRVMQGDYGQKIVIKSTNEINTLADTFNKMNQKLITSRTNDRFVFLGHISARMAHEIRKPMNIIQLIAESVKKRGEFREDDYQAVVKEIDNADRFIREILEFVKPDELTLNRYSLGKLTLAVLEKFRLKFKKSKIQVFHDIEENIPEFYMDIFRMEQVISNILNNAAQAIGSDGRIVVVLKKDVSKNQVNLEISDTGPGIDQEIRDRIFDPYFTSKSEGIGLGLSICYRILMGHGAEIETDDASIGGALVRITFFAPT
jgi:signal transduction histidine kinase